MGTVKDLSDLNPCGLLAVLCKIKTDFMPVTERATFKENIVTFDVV